MCRWVKAETELRKLELRGCSNEEMELPGLNDGSCHGLGGIES